MTKPPARRAKKARTTCPYCGVGCGLLVKTGKNGDVEVAGDPDHPANKGRLCSKGAALAETISLDGRLLHPLIEGRESRWDEALDLVAERFRTTIDRHGPDSVAFYVSGQLTTEDYYVANKLMKGFIGSGNIDTNSRLCMSSSVAGHKRAFGSDTVPGCYEDLELADLVVLVGSNLAWCHPVLYQRLARAREVRGTKVVVIDPRRTATCDIADIYLPIEPGTDVALFNGLLTYLHRRGATVGSYISVFTNGFDDALEAASPWTVEKVAAETGVPAFEIERFYDRFARTAKTVTVYSQGVNQSSVGTDKVNAILNTHLATGRIGRPGMGPFSVTGQPNAMGGREVGGLANQLAAHMEIESAADRKRVQQFWKSPGIAKKGGLKAVDLFRAVGAGKIKALWIMGTNPVDSLPEADEVRTALAACPFVVVSDVERHTDTTAMAHVLLPSAAWGEKSGTVTNSERRISRQRSFLPLPGQARPDWWQLTQVARRLGFAHAFPYEHPAEIFAEHAALSGFGNGGTRDFDISAYREVSRSGYDHIQPFQWPAPADSDTSARRLFADGRFFTPDGRARLVATPHAGVGQKRSKDWPFLLNTGRIRDQWHTMTRSGRSPRLSQHLAEPFVEIHPEDAAAYGIEDAVLVAVDSTHGQVLARALITPRQKRSTVFMPIHWTDRFAAAGRVDKLVEGRTDPVSGQPESKLTPVSIAPFRATWHGFAVLKERPQAVAADYWALARTRTGWRLELASANVPDDWAAYLTGLVTGDARQDLEQVAYTDPASGAIRVALFRDNELIAALYVSPGPVEVSRSWATDQLDVAFASHAARLQVLAGRAGGDVEDKGATVCACFEIGYNQIAGVAAAPGTTVDCVGKAVSAGTNCGSCRPEIQRIIDEHQLREAV